MGYQYKKVELVDDIRMLNGLGQAGWEVVGIVNDEKQTLLLSRDADLPLVRDGLEDHPLGSTLVSIVMEPQGDLRPDMQDTLKYLRSGGNGIPGDVLPAPESSIISTIARKDGSSETLRVACSGLIRLSRVDFPFQDEAIIPDITWAQWVLERMKLFSGILEHWENSGDVRAVLTISGIQGLRLNHTKWSGDIIVLGVPYVQVAHIAPAQAVSDEGLKPIVRLLFEKFYWSVGVERNVAFPE